ncbi:hypothetical protein ACI782_09565 [Geodermatophilus sp. SYSU D00703]
MARTTSDVAPPFADQPSVAPRGGPRWLVPAALLLTAVPFVVAAVRVLLTRDASFQFAGDQAIIGLATHEAGDGDQQLGPYSRYGWAHPGPAWFYLMAPWMRLFGDDDAALVAASLVVHGLLAVLLVAAVPRRARAVVGVLAAGVVLLYVLRMPGAFFVDVWNPYALLLGTALFLVLAVRCREGRWTGLLLLVAAGSYLVQTHIGTAPLVAAVGLAGLVAFVVGRRRRPPAEGVPAAPASRRSGLATAAAGALVVALWCPVVQQQVTAAPGQGNLRLLLDFFLLDPPPDAVHPTLLEALIAVGRVLAMTPYGWGPGPWEMDVSTLPAAVLVGLVAQAAASVLLLVAGRLWRRPGAWWSGVVTLVALLAAIASAKTVSGILYWYLLTWVSVLPAVTVLGLLGLADRLPVPGALRSRAVRLARAAAPAALAVLAALAALVAVSLSRGLAALPASEAVTAAQRLLDGQLAAGPGDVVRVDIATHDRWPVAAGLVENLAAEDVTVTVSAGSADLFGAARVSDGGEDAVVTVAAPDDPALGQLVAAGTCELGTVAGPEGPTTVLLTAGG